MTGIPSQVLTYSQAAAQRLAGVLGDDLVAVYLHGSGAMGGWVPGRSDVDLLAVASRPLNEDEKHDIAQALMDPGFPAPGAGLEFSLVGAPIAEPLPPKPVFELHVTNGADAKVVDGAGHPGDPDLVLHYAVCRERGVTVVGPPPESVFPMVPRALLLAGLRDELKWARKHAPARYAVLNALRAWAFAESGTLLSKFEAVAWAKETARFSALAQRAWLAQTGITTTLAPEDVNALLSEAALALAAAETDR